MTSPQETASSRKGKDSDSAKLDSETLAGEVVTLRRDLWLFRTVYLPVLLRSASPELLERWQQTAQKLADAVPRDGNTLLASPDWRAVKELLPIGYPEDALRLMYLPSPWAVPAGDGFCWHIYPYSGQATTEREEQVRFVLRWAEVGDERASAPWLELMQVLPTVQEFFASLPPMSDKKMGGYIAVLPILAELDPMFVVQALDRGRLLAIVEGDLTLTPKERERQRRFLDTGFFARCLCNSLALILEALANNHFAKIGNLLALPDLNADSYWSGLVPKILLVTLFWKTSALQSLAWRLPTGDIGQDTEELQR
jgi:hypothetical protein